jgi:hypothetical protein
VSVLAGIERRRLSGEVTLQRICAEQRLARANGVCHKGRPVILSEFVTLKKTTGLHGDGTACTLGSMLCVHRPSFALHLGSAKFNMNEPNVNSKSSPRGRANRVDSGVREGHLTHPQFLLPSGEIPSVWRKA